MYPINPRTRSGKITTSGISRATEVEWCTPVLLLPADDDVDDAAGALESSGRASACWRTAKTTRKAERW